MGIILDALAAKRLLLSDGALGTMLQAEGLQPGDCPEEWNLTHPDVVRKIIAGYVEVGSDLVATNTFGGTVYKMKKYGLADTIYDLNFAGVKLALEAAGDKAMVAASVGPTGEFLEPYGDVEEEEMEEAFFNQVKAQADAGAKAIIVETMTGIEEACCAVRAAKKVDLNLDVICTMTFDPGPNGFHTMMGVDCKRAAEELSKAGADILGANCGNGMEQMILLIRDYRAVTDKPLLVHSNAGVPELINGKTVFRESPESMAAGVATLVEAGANIIGGCCGTTPEHIKAMGKELDKLR
ncbi:MAG: homocysteine S-methyltransferase family protein [Planctomycetes bacterium]|nr:homocysteine S-methyltransferase family protein [Planctomycetota bacterium]